MDEMTSEDWDRIIKEVNDRTLEYVVHPKRLEVIDAWIEEYCKEVIDVLNKNKISCTPADLTNTLAEFVQNGLSKYVQQVICKKVTLNFIVKRKDVDKVLH